MSTATGPQPPPSEPTPSEPPASEPAARGRSQLPAAARRGPGSWTDMVRTMLVVLAFVGLIVLLVPRPGQLPRPAVDVRSAVSGVESQLGFRPVVPTGLPAGWSPNAAETRGGTDGVTSFHLGYVTDDGMYAGVDQASSITQDWLNSTDGGGQPVGDVTIDGVSWQQLDAPDRQYTSLLLRRPGQVVLVTTQQGGVATATVLARALHLTA